MEEDSTLSSQPLHVSGSSVPTRTFDKSAHFISDDIFTNTVMYLARPITAGLVSVIWRLH